MITIPNYMFWLIIASLWVFIIFNGLNAYYRIKINNNCKEIFRIINENEEARNG